MKTFVAFIRKEFHHIFRDQRTLMVLFGMPLAQILLFGYAITTEVQNAKVAILDKSRDVESTSLTQSILTSTYFTSGAEIVNYADIERAFKRADIKVAVVIPEDFAESVERGAVTIQVLADGADPNTANTLVNYLRAIIGQSLPMTTSGMAPVINVEQRFHYNTNQRSVNMFVPGVITIILLLVSAMLTSIAITREKELGTMEILLVSPLRPITIILGKVVPYLVLSMVNVGFIISIGYFIFQVPMNGSWLFLVVECTAFVVCALSLGVLISTIAKTQQVALMMSLMVLMLPTILLSNFIFPVSSMPLPLQVISNIIPAKYFINIIRGIMLKGVGPLDLIFDTTVLVGMTLVFILISMKKFKIRL